MNEVPFGAGELMGENESKERYVFYVTLPSLQEMAANQVALAIWYSYLSRAQLNESMKESVKELPKSLGIEEDYWKECVEAIESLKTPRSIEEILKTAIDLVTDEMHSWIRHFQYDTFSYNLENYRFSRFDANCCVWFPNGKIDYARTGPKMLSTPGLTDVQKFAIMSEFCLRKEIDRFSLRSLPESFVNEVEFDRDYLMYYWIRYLKNDLGSVPLRNFSSVDVAMAVMCENEHWTAFEYFWNRLSIMDQVTVVVFRCGVLSTYYIDQLRLFSLMSWQQQQKVLSVIPDEILINFWVRFHSPESAIWTWDHSRDLMTVEQFAAVVKTMFSRVIPFEEEMRKFLYIWNTASDQQRNHVVRSFESEIILPFFCMAQHCPAAFDFLYIFLSMKSVESRKRLILENAGEFGAQVEDPNSLTEVINLSLPNVYDQLAFKRSAMESHEMLRRGEFLFNDSELQKLKIKIQFYSVDSNTAQRYVKKLLESKMIKKQMYITNVEKWNKFSEFVDDIYSNDELSGLNTKKKFISGYASNCRNDWNDDNSLNEMIEVLGMVFSSDDELQVVKQTFLDSFRKALVDMDYWPWFEEKYFNRFVSWCVGGDEGVEVFKKSISVDAIFDEYFDNFEEWYSEDGGFDKSLLPDLDKCLRWYFNGVEGARNYKLGKINSFEDIGILKSIFERNDEESLGVFLKWFFEDDDESIRKFKADKLEGRK